MLLNKLSSHKTNFHPDRNVINRDILGFLFLQKKIRFCKQKVEQMWHGKFGNFYFCVSCILQRCTFLFTVASQVSTFS